MIDEDALRELLTQAGEAVPPPGGAPAELLEMLAAARDEPRQLNPRRFLVPAGAAAAALLVVALVAGVISNGDGNGNRSTDLTAAAPSTTIAPTGVAREVGAPNDVSTSAKSGTTGGAATPQATPPPATPRDSAKVVKTGSLDLEVGKGTFRRTVDRVTSLVVGMGGYVSESTTAEAEKVPRGAITVRVPATSFEQLITELRRLGRVESVTSKGTDVTAQFTDLDARLTALQATRDRLYEVLRGASTVGDIIAVQDRITGVQTEIEQIQGQQRLLTDQASFGTLSITLGEPGAQPPTEGADKGLGGAWREARRRFGNAVEGLVEASGTAAVVAIVALVLGGLGWLGWTRGRRHLL